MENPFHRVMVRRRGELGLSQAQAAARAGVARSTWNTWESIEELPHRDKWHLIAKVLEMPIDELEKAGATHWFLECGPSPFQLSMLQSLGIHFDGVLPDHQFSDPNLYKLDQQLDVDLERLGFPQLVQKVGNLRNQIRKILVTHDAAQQELRQMVSSFCSLFDLMVPRSYTPQLKQKPPKVTKKSPAGARKLPESQ